MNRRSETLALVGMAIGVATMLQPWWSGGMRAGFLITFACTIGQIVVSHLPKERS